MSAARTALAIAGVNVQRLTKDRTALFFVVIFPFLLIFVLGVTFSSGFVPRLGLVGAAGRLADDLERRLRALDGVEIRVFADETRLRDAVIAGEVEGGVVIPARYDRDLRAGRPVAVPWVALPAGTTPDLSPTVSAVIDEQGGLVNAARVAVEHGAAGSFDEGLAAARAAADTLPGTDVTVSTAGGDEGSAVGTAAAQEMVLFVFVTSLSAAAMLVESRRLGVSRRMIASPTSVSTVLAGEALGRYAIALIQGLLILVGSILLFGVDWGNLATAGVTVSLLALAATGAAMLFGSLMRSEQQAGSVGVFAGLALAALGGAMVPIEIFPPVMERIAHLTPHSWAIGAMSDAITRGWGPLAAWRDLAVLAAYGAALFVVAVPVFRRSLIGAAASA